MTTLGAGRRADGAGGPRHTRPVGGAGGLRARLDARGPVLGHSARPERLEPGINIHSLLLYSGNSAEADRRASSPVRTYTTPGDQDLRGCARSESATGAPFGSRHERNASNLRSSRGSPISTESEVNHGSGTRSTIKKDAAPHLTCGPTPSTPGCPAARGGSPAGTNRWRSTRPARCPRRRTAGPRSA